MDKREIFSGGIPRLPASMRTFMRHDRNFIPLASHAAERNIMRRALRPAGFRESSPDRPFTKLAPLFVGSYTAWRFRGGALLVLSAIASRSGRAVPSGVGIGTIAGIC